MKKGYSVTRDFSWIKNCKLNGNSVVQNHSGGSNSNTINSRSSHRSCSVRKSVLRNFAKFTRKHPFQSLYVNKVARLSYRTPTNDCFLTIGNSSAIRKNNISSRVRRDNNFTSSKQLVLGKVVTQDSYDQMIQQKNLVNSVQSFNILC